MQYANVASVVMISQFIDNYEYRNCW